MTFEQIREQIEALENTRRARVQEALKLAIEALDDVLPEMEGRDIGNIRLARDTVQMVLKNHGGPAIPCPGSLGVPAAAEETEQ